MTTKAKTTSQIVAYHSENRIFFMDQVDVLIFETIFWDKESSSSSFQTLFLRKTK